MDSLLCAQVFFGLQTEASQDHGQNEMSYT